MQNFPGVGVSPGRIIGTIRQMPKPVSEPPAGEQLPAGVTIAINLTLLHYDPELWDRPEQFEPERFLGRPPSPSIYNPFGGGNRRCLGATFARYEMAIVLGTLLREYEFEPLDEHVEWKRGMLTLEPIGGVNTRIRSRARVRVAA